MASTTTELSPIGRIDVHKLSVYLARLRQKRFLTREGNFRYSASKKDSLIYRVLREKTVSCEAKGLYLDLNHD